MMSKLLEVPGTARASPIREEQCTPNRLLTCGEDAEGRRQQVWQHEGGEQEDLLMPLLFSLAVRNSLEEVHQQMEPGEELMAFMDDTNVVFRARADQTNLQFVGARSCSSALALGCMKAKLVCGTGEGSDCPADMQNLGPEVCCPDGINILGTPVECAEFEEAATDARLEEETLWAAMGWIPDLQCAWQVLVQCAGPRCHHLFRTMPPIPFSTVCARSRWRDAESHEVSSGRSPRGRSPASCRCTDRVTPHAFRRLGAQICIENGSRVILGVVGRRFAHVACKVASSCRARYHDIGP